MFKNNVIFKKYPILSFTIGIILLIAFIISIVFVVKTITKEDENVKYTLSELEEINVDVSDKNISYFENLDFIGKSIEDLKSEFKNVVLVNDDLIRMQNVELFSLSGTFVLNIKDSKVENYTFTSKPIISADDTVTVINELNTTIASKTKQNKKELVFFKTGTQTDFSNPSDLYEEGTYLEATYKINNTNLTIRAEREKDKYIIKIYTW